jgi:hypothetical protein
MKSTWRLTTALLVSLVACSRNQHGATAPSQSRVFFPDSQAAAEDALKALKKMVDLENYQLYGFGNATEVRDATLGDATKLFTISNAKLAEYKAGTNVYSLLTDTHRDIYPVLVSGEAKTLITVAQEDQGWRFAGYGDSAVAKNLVRIRNNKVTNAGGGPGSSPSEYYDIRIQSLGADFLAIDLNQTGPRGGSEAMLTPLSDTGELAQVRDASKGPGRPSIQSGFTPFLLYMKKNPKFTPQGEAVKPATDVLGALAPAAKQKETVDGPS